MTRLQIDDIVANMAESLDDLTETPRRIILSGEGLKRMDVRVFKGLVRNLGRLGIEVEDFDMGSGEVEEPRIISKLDFMRAARERDLSKVSTGKTWHALTEPRRKFSRAQDKLVSGARLYSWERESLYIPQWQVELSVSEEELIYDNVSEAYGEQRLLEIDGMGIAYEKLVGVILNELEIKTDTDQH